MVDRERERNVSQSNPGIAKLRNGASLEIIANEQTKANQFDSGFKFFPALFPLRLRLVTA